MSKKKKKRKPRPSKRYYTDVEFGYDDGNIRTVQIGIHRTGAPSWWLDASVTLKGVDLDMVTAAFFHLRGYDVWPGLKTYRLRKYKNASTTTITDDRMHYKKGVVGPLSFQLSNTDDRPDDLRLWVQSTKHTHVWLNIDMNKKTADEFGRRLAEAAEWDV